MLFSVLNQAGHQSVPGTPIQDITVAMGRLTWPARSTVSFLMPWFAMLCEMPKTR